MTWKVPTKLPRNFKKTDWPRFTNLLENELHTSHLNFNQHPDKLRNDITNIMIRPCKLNAAIKQLKCKKSPGVYQFGEIKENIATPNNVILNHSGTPNNVLTEPFRPCKLNAAIKQLKCKKSPGVYQFGEIKENIATPNNVILNITPNNVLTEPFRPCELNAAIKQLKCKKSPGDDCIHPEFLIRMGPIAK
ncbi:unnamed protein product [Rodentolepis nana]|uniref:PRE_C2HC domain-containing protein n=1 Tax=Rodentolepis nana TaxID=102285 RepID=A0A0R3TDS6_RODNA|nr:unnamed protein product [Rodentolepis nana]